MKILLILIVFTVTCVYGQNDDNIIMLDTGAVLDGGEWTDWLNSPTESSYGDFENVKKYRETYNEMLGYCALWCDEPTAVEWKLRPGYELAEDCVNLYADEMRSRSRSNWGFNCYGYKQETNQQCSRDECVAAKMYDSTKMTFRTDAPCNTCPDFEVRYYCPGDKAAQQANCLDLQSRMQMEATRELFKESEGESQVRKQALEHDIRTQVKDEYRRELINGLFSVLAEKGDK